MSRRTAAYRWFHRELPDERGWTKAEIWQYYRSEMRRWQVAPRHCDPNKSYLICNGPYPIGTCLHSAYSLKKRGRP
jgi:hypothetical protein